MNANTLSFLYKTEINHDNSMILTIMTYVGCGLSIVGCLITVIIFEFFRYFEFVQINSSIYSNLKKIKLRADV